MPRNDGVGMSTVAQSVWNRRASASAYGTSFRACAVGEVAAVALLLGAVLGDEVGLAIGIEQLLDRRDGQRSIDHMHDRLVVLRGDLHRRVLGAVVAPPISSGTVNPRRCISLATCTISSSDGVISPRQADDVGLRLDRGLQNLLARDHHAEVDDLEVVAPQHDADDVLADVVDVAFDGGDDDGAAVRTES